MKSFLMLLAALSFARALTLFPYYMNETMPSFELLEGSNFAFMGGASDDPNFAADPSICQSELVDDKFVFNNCGQLACAVTENLTHIFSLQKDTGRIKLLSTKIITPSSPIYKLRMSTKIEGDSVTFYSVPEGFNIAYSPSCAESDKTCVVGLCKPLDVDYNGVKDIKFKRVTTGLAGRCLDSDIYYCE